MIIDLDYILDNKKHKQKKLIGIYFLIKNNKVVYVGQTTIGLGRVFAHTDKDFDYYTFVKCDKENLNKFEAENIIEYKPKYNKVLNEEYISVNMMKKRIKTLGYESKFHNKKYIKKIIENNKIKMHHLNLKGCYLDYIKRSDFDIVLKEVQNESYN